LNDSYATEWVALQSIKYAKHHNHIVYYLTTLQHSETEMCRKRTNSIRIKAENIFLLSLFTIFATKKNKQMDLTNRSIITFSNVTIKHFGNQLIKSRVIQEHRTAVTHIYQQRR